MPDPDPHDDVLDGSLPDAGTGSEDQTNTSGDGESDVPINAEYWQERLYKASDTYDIDAKFFENALKSAHLEGKMSAREMTFAKGGGLPTLSPLPAGMQGSATA